MEGNLHRDGGVEPVEDAEDDDQPPVDLLVVGEVDEVVCPPGRVGPERGGGASAKAQNRKTRVTKPELTPGLSGGDTEEEGAEDRADHLRRRGGAKGR